MEGVAAAMEGRREGGRARSGEAGGEPCRGGSRSVGIKRGPTDLT